MIRNIIFDWSGTLVDDLPAVWEATNYVFKQAGLPEMTLDEFRAEFCLPFTKFYNKFTPGVPVEKLEAWFHSHFRQCQESVVPLPHAREFLEFCRAQKMRTFVLSSVHPDHFRVQAEVTGFAEFIDEPFIGVWDKREKIHAILEQHRLIPDETLFIGDMQHDIETAKHGGVHSCAVLTGYNSLVQLRAAVPDRIVEHLGELRELLAHESSVTVNAASALHTFPIVTVGAVIFHPTNGDVLMFRTHKWSNMWGIPGGKVRYSETCLEALRRELKEETNLDIGDIRFVLVQDCIESEEFYRKAHFVLLNYTCHAREPLDVQLNDEAQEFRWLPIEEALALALNQPTRILLEAICEGGEL
ncbi:MAG TPA: HAD hydrolase-like protein [Candidatus Acidoferrum sp.]|nr:HAD hydrolase-like protein [Candidatus Acidoferrum sp.]